MCLASLKIDRFAYPTVKRTIAIWTRWLVGMQLIENEIFSSLREIYWSWLCLGSLQLSRLDFPRSPGHNANSQAKYTLTVRLHYMKLYSALRICTFPKRWAFSICFENGINLSPCATSLDVDYGTRYSHMSTTMDCNTGWNKLMAGG